MRIQAHGLAVDTTLSVDARIYRRAPEAGETTHPIVHVCTRTMPEERGDYGGGAVDRLQGDDVFVSLMEFDPGQARDALFSTVGRPTTFDPDVFKPAALQRVQNGQSGAQFWFTEEGRPFCLYVVLGSHANRRRLIPKVAEIVAALQIGPRSITVDPLGPGGKPTPTTPVPGTPAPTPARGRDPGKPAPSIPTPEATP